MVGYNRKKSYTFEDTQHNTIMNPLNLQLTKPLVFLKVHTTGLKPNMDRVVQITITKYHVDGTSKTGTRLINPEMPIPAEVTQLNGITDEMVYGKPTFYQIAQGLHQFIGDSDIAGFSVEFDLKFLMEEFGRASIDFNCAERNIIDLKEIYHTLQPRDFNAAAQKYAGQNFQSGVPIPSETFASTCVGILNGMMEAHKVAPVKMPDGSETSFGSTVDEINTNFSSGSNSLDMKGYLVKDNNGNIILTYGKKHKNRPLQEIMQSDRSYLDWLVNQSEVPRDTKNIISAYIKKINSTPQNV